LTYAVKFLAGLTKIEERTSNGSHYTVITPNSEPSGRKEDGSAVEGSGMSKYESIQVYKHNFADLINKIQAQKA
jgi:hypothetical protein